MITKIGNSEKKGILLACALLAMSVCSKAQGSTNFFSKVYDNLIKDSQASFFIIAGVVIIGFVAFMVNKMANKNNEKDEKGGKNTIRPMSHRHHHHHRIIKKSA